MYWNALCLLLSVLTFEWERREEAGTLDVAGKKAPFCISSSSFLLLYGLQKGRRKGLYQEEEEEYDKLEEGDLPDTFLSLPPSLSLFHLVKHNGYSRRKATKGFNVVVGIELTFALLNIFHRPSDWIRFPSLFSWHSAKPSTQKRKKSGEKNKFSIKEAKRIRNMCPDEIDTMMYVLGYLIRYFKSSCLCLQKAILTCTYGVLLHRFGHTVSMFSCAAWPKRGTHVRNISVTKYSLAMYR